MVFFWDLYFADFYKILTVLFGYAKFSVSNNLNRYIQYLGLIYPLSKNPTRKLITLYGVASAMLYLHSYNIDQRDLKPDNILMVFQKYYIVYQLRLLYSSQKVLIDDEYTPAGDVYSFGIIAYEVITNEEPFKNSSFTELLIKVTNGA